MNQKVPFRSLYSNDMTNLENCTSAYHAKGENFTPEHLRESVREVEGLADVAGSFRSFDRININELI